MIRRHTAVDFKPTPPRPAPPPSLLWGRCPRCSGILSPLPEPTCLSCGYVDYYTIGSDAAQVMRKP